MVTRLWLTSDDMNVLIVDYGMGNIGSVRRAIQVAGGVPLVTGDPADIERAVKSFCLALARFQTECRL